MRAAAAPRTLRGLAMHAVRRIREANAAQVELRERVWLRQEPWREEFLHWSFDGDEWRLHGERLPWPDGRGRSVTRSGWCPRAVSSE
jgi:hypothetical protein